MNQQSVAAYFDFPLQLGRPAGHCGRAYRYFPVPPSGHTPTHDAHHLHLAVQLYPEKERSAEAAQCPQPAPHRRQRGAAGDAGDMIRSNSAVGSQNAQ